MQEFPGSGATAREAHTLCHTGSIYYRNFNFDEGLKCAGEALAIGISLKDTAVIIRALRLFADNYYAMGQYEKSTEYFLEELACHEKSHDIKKIAEVYCNIGVNYEERGLLERGMYYYLEALKIYEQVDDKEGIVATLSNLAYVYRSQGNNTEAIAYFKRASEIEQEYLPVKKKYYFMANIAEAYKNMGRIDTAIEHLARADSILKNIENPDDEDLLIWIDVAKTQADIYNELGNTGKAYTKYLEALTLSRKTGYPEKEGRVVAALGTMLMKTGDLVQARYYLDEGRRIAEETGSFYLKKDVYQALSDVAGRQKAYREAWEYHQLYSAASDSVINLESAAQLANMQVKYETEKKEDQIQLLTQENEIRELRLQKSESQKLYMALTALLLLLLTGLTLNRYRLKKKSATLLAAKNTELSILNATKDKFFAIIAHDLKNPVSAFHNIAGQIDRYFDSLSADELKYYIRELSSTSSGLLAMLKNLLEWSKSQRGQINPLLTEVSPAAVIEKAIEETGNLSRASNISVVTKTSGSHLILSDENILVTVLRNLLTNAIKFSPEKSKITIGSELSNGQLFFSVADQGIGISDEDMKKLFRIDVDTKTIGRSSNKGAGLGLIICQEFLQKIGGKIWAESDAGKGSTFYISVPAKKIDQTET
ncbi:MAG: tetratricopeptide repeat-containing sensor histidine kinase [Bacteroidales bacterium]|nr:tetratricopeptide repeat-containing sensor histidine kinase [Bacteroidales bacterium]MBN2763400.1 tetratricopeptide repeat-containing sensor histidine kinase [Bacteroidales bacterium]